MTSILYFTRDDTTHDRRFLSALAKTDLQIHYLRLERRNHALDGVPLPRGVMPVNWSNREQEFNSWDAPQYAANLKEVLRQVQPDLIHAGPIQSAAFITALADFHPLISMSWGYDLLLDAEQSEMQTWITRYTLQRSAVLVGDCETVRNKAISLGMDSERIVIFPWGVDLQTYQPGTASRNKDGYFTILSTRSWEPIYGVDVLARAFVIVSQERPELRLILLGSGSQAEEIKNIFLDGGVLNRVEFPGQVPEAKLVEYYQQAHLYVSASHVDGSSVSLMEAMACGCPVLVSDIPGNREWVEPGIHGWLFPDGDSEALAKGILQAADFGHLLPSMGLAARSTAEKRANWEVNFSKLLQAYKMALTTNVASGVD